VKPLEWMRAVRDALPKPGPRSSRLVVLFCLALRMRPDGTGFCSQPQLAEDAEVHATTVRRHLTWARDTGYLVRTRRGHRLGNGTKIASEYALSQPSTGALLSTASTEQMAGLNRADGGSQPSTGARPRGLTSRGPHPSARAPATNGQPSDPRGAVDEMDWAMTEDRRVGLVECRHCERPSRSAGTHDGKLCSDCAQLPAYDTDHKSGFAWFWDMYPRKAAKPAAHAAWHRALGRGVAANKMLNAAHHYGRERADKPPEYTKLPANWLDEERYNDEPAKETSE